MQILPAHAGRTARATGLGIAVALVLSACTKPAPDMTATPPVTAATVPSEAELELKWARLALARNPTLEVIASDPANGVITIRLKDTGEVRAVKANDLAAMPVAALTAAAKTSVEPQAPAAAAAPVTPASSSNAAPTPSASMTAAAAQPTTSSNYTIERADGQVKVSGPGVSIVSTGTAAVAATADDPSQRGADPIICEGRRMLHFDNRNIYVEGDAIIARGGCELYITNSRVAADGTGVVVHDATVHISNSTIEGGAASFQADDSAKVYVRGSTFQGVPRRSERALVQDQGGNQWR
jgi:hypothetical protein